MNEYYDHSTYPATGATGSSAALRAELDLIEAGFAKLPSLAGKANQAIYVKPDGAGLEAREVSGTATASSVSFTPTGGVEATNVQAAIAELDSEKQPTISTLPANKGGTGLNSFTIGELLYATGATTLGKLADVATGDVLLSGGVGGAPVYGKVTLTAHVSGVLPVANGGTGVATLTGVAFGNGTGVFTAATAAQLVAAIGATTVANATNSTTTTTATEGTATTAIASTAFVDRLRDVIASTQSGAYTLALTDRGKSVDTSAGVTVPLNSAVAFGLGSTISITNTSASAITITQTSGVTLRQAGTTNTGNRTLAAYGAATLRKVATDTWFVFGAGLS